MRRADRQVTDVESILLKCAVGRLGLCDGDRPYIVPLNFGFEFENGALILYFHSAREGKKLDYIAKNPNVCFETDCSHALVRGANACSYSFRYESVIAFGEAELIEDYDKKVYALQKIMERQDGVREYAFNPKSVERVAVIRLRCTDYTAKASKNAAD